MVAGFQPAYLPAPSGRLEACDHREIRAPFRARAPIGQDRERRGGQGEQSIVVVPKSALNPCRLDPKRVLDLAHVLVEMTDATVPDRLLVRACAVVRCRKPSIEFFICPLIKEG